MEARTARLGRPLSFSCEENYENFQAGLDTSLFRYYRGLGASRNMDQRASAQGAEFYQPGRALLFSKRDCELIEFISALSRSGLIECYEDEESEDANPDGQEAGSQAGGLSYSGGFQLVLDMERRARQAYRVYGDIFPTAIWNCCSRSCFLNIAIDRTNTALFEEVWEIYIIAEGLHKRIERTNTLVQSRKSGVGGSNVAFNSATRSVRQPDSSTDRQKNIRQLAKFAIEVLRFLTGKTDAPSGTPRPRKRLCTEAICCLLGVSRNFLYQRKRSRLMSDSLVPDDALKSIVDSAEVRFRQHRRIGLRAGYPEVDELPNFNCGCPDPCFRGVPVWRLHKEYNEFSSIATQLKPRRKENRYLLNAMFCPLMNTPVSVCNRALSALYTVSQGHIADVCMILKRLCDESCEHEEHLMKEGTEGYKKNPQHPMNRYSDAVREKVEAHLDILLRPDPGASDGVNTCRVYSPEIKTQEKLRKTLAKSLEEDGEADVHLSTSTLQRMVLDYLKERNCRISFLQSDHNACPTCKTLKYAVLQYSFDVKSMKARLQSASRPLTRLQHTELASLESSLVVKQHQEATCLRELKEHNGRDASIRRFVKNLIDHLRTVENSYREKGDRGPTHWKGRPDHGIVTHQDDMTKVDLPHFIETASSDITRWRYGVTAHVHAVTEQTIVFSHEQGGGEKNAAAIMERILLDHIIRCKGESLKVVVSDNASVGKNWLTVVGLPQYIVDQGLADVVLMVFLENNHGKFLADMLFGQLQIRKKRSTILGIDALLTEFESINQRSGAIQSFAVNPLSSVDFGEVLVSLGYETKPPKDVCFTKRNVHFAAACAPGAQGRLSDELKTLLSDLLPEEPGMVRLSTNPPSGVPRKELPYESRFLDVPAASRNIIRSHSDATSHSVFEGASCGYSSESFLVVPMDQKYEASGHGVVSTRHMNHVGYNGLEFRKSGACPELHDSRSRIVREAWPPGLLRTSLAHRIRSSTVAEPSTDQHIKCAPENWVVRRPVSHFRSNDGAFVARYPPRNMLNAKFGRAPRDPVAFEGQRWVPTATYDEPPLPLSPLTCSFQAFQELANDRGGPDLSSLGNSMNTLDVLRVVYKNVGNRETSADPFLHNGVTIPSLKAVQAYLKNDDLFKKREAGQPKPPMTVYAASKDDVSVKEEVERRVIREGYSGAQTQLQMRTRIVRELFGKAERNPLQLAKYEALVEKDLERYTRELKHFREVVQREFDVANNILPTGNG